MTGKLRHPPRLHRASAGAHERKITWLELFYDLVYVATLIQIGNALSEDITLNGFLRFAIVFIPVWWAWTGITFYMNRFVVDDLWHRLLIYLQIVAIAFLGLSVEGAFAGLATQFALSYAAIRLILVALYVRTWRYEPATKPLTQRYVIGYLVGIALWVISAFVPMPYAAILWFAAIAVEIGNIIAPKTRALQTLLPPDPPHMRERYGIFVLIVLGESFIKTISAASGTAVTWGILAFSLLGIFVVFALWWLYFDDVEGSEIRKTHSAPYIWIYSHLPLTLGITAFGVAAKKIFESVGKDHIKPNYIILFCTALIFYALAVALIDFASQRHGDQSGRNVRIAWRLAMALALVVLMVFGRELAALPFIIIVAAIMLAQIVADEWSARQSQKPISHEA